MRTSPYKKSLGQHFLHNRSVVKAMCTDYQKDFDSIIEIGPGEGALTKTLSLLGKPLYVFEKDRSFGKKLQGHILKDHIIIVDALDVDFERFCLTKELKRPWPIGNLPYNISVPLLIKFLQVPSFNNMTLMFQREVADRIVGQAGKKNCESKLTALVQNYFHIKQLIRVSAGSFIPSPKVESSVLSFRRIHNPLIPLKLFHSFERFLKLSFSQRRKQLYKLLLKDHDKNLVIKALSHLELSKFVRAEALTPRELGQLYILLAPL